MSRRERSTPGRAPRIIPALAAALALLAGCGGGSSDAVKAAPSVGVAPPGEGSATAAPTGVPDTEFLGSTPVNSAQFTDEAGFISFTTPDMSVGCTIATATAPAVTCQPKSFSYTVTEPGSCPQGPAWGSTVTLTTEKPTWVCSTDTVGGTKVLAYGARIDVQGYNCVDRPDGVTCHYAQTDHGFRISPKYYTFF